MKKSTDLAGIDADAGAHRGGDDAGTDILALAGGRLRLDDRAEQSVEVLLQLLRAEGNLADNAVDDVGLVETVLDLTGLGVGDSLADLAGHGAGLRVRHQAAGTEDLTETANQAHHVGGGDEDVEIHPVLALDLLDHVLRADELGACGLGVLRGVALADREDAHGLAGAVGQNDGAADLLVGMTAVNAQLHVNLDGLVELGGAGLDAQVESLVDVIELKELFVCKSNNKTGDLEMNLLIFSSHTSFSVKAILSVSTPSPKKILNERVPTAA